MRRLCEYCQLKFYPHEYKLHNCPQRPTCPQPTVEEPIGDFSVVSHTSESTHNTVSNAIEHMRESCTTALANVQSRIPQIHSEPSTRSLSEESTDTRKITTSRVTPKPFDPYVRRRANKRPYLGDRNGKSSVTSQTSYIQQVNPEKAGPSGSKPKRIRREPPESATRERAVSMSAFENVGRMEFKEITELLYPRNEQSTSSSHLRETLTQETASVASTSRGASVASTSRGASVASTSRGASVAPMLNAQLDHKSRKHYCSLCKKDFDTWVTLDAHIDILQAKGVKNAMAHNHSPCYLKQHYFVCMVCNSRFDRQIDLDFHWRAKHQAPTPYKCTYCNKAFQRKESLSNQGACSSCSHLQDTTRESVRTTSTRLADLGSSRTPQGSSEQAATSGSGLGAEMLVGGPVGSTSRGASVASTSRGASAAPMLNARLDNRSRNRYCSLCKKRFARWGDLDAHVLILQENGDEHAMAHNHSPYFFKKHYFVCNFCNDPFDRQIDLDSHHSAKHQAHTPYKCIYCKKACQSSGGLCNHESQMHKDKTIHKCKTCHKRFFDENSLKNHTCKIPEN